MNPTLRHILAPAAAVTLAVGLLAGCAPASTPGVTHPVVAPVTKSLGSLLDATVKVPLNSVLNITGVTPVNGLVATIHDSSIAKFTQGHKDSTATFNPGIKPLKVGTTTVDLEPKSGAYEGVTFTLIVTKG